ncbi:type IV toxin-antitoxin system AbiEi family antitoxin domain-containing protein [Telmatocola sphagniphila]|uniref:Type IV toxin-antitoxin system AbiEi family antitoxin domain-containing protein n=1 Tax=Telmatocola sphagniphila TaxID=1123043 RepID=A0A8E6B8E8_9BACT|nr:DUF6088 family protein [Telmatocola sphagniphila]QVL33036.1 type IV toxin-antitoxin system AbiEi family antitoxin domain-containing protein [Telmatocola sphagniphila]
MPIRVDHFFDQKPLKHLLDSIWMVCPKYPFVRRLLRNCHILIACFLSEKRVHFSDRNGIMTGTIQDSILKRIRREGRGKVFIPKDFLDLGSRAAADQSLSRLVRQGNIQRLGRGLYHYPRINERLGIPLGPDLDEIAAALARQTGSRVVPSGAVAANRLGLTTQVPAKLVYLTDGRTRQVKVGGTSIQIRHVPPKELPLGSPINAMVFQALRHLGQGIVDEKVIGLIRKALTREQRRALLSDARYTTDWIAVAISKISQDEIRVAENG